MDRFSFPHAQIGHLAASARANCVQGYCFCTVVQYCDIVAVRFMGCKIDKLPLRGVSPDVLLVSKEGAILTPVCSCDE